MIRSDPSTGYRVAETPQRSLNGSDSMTLVSLTRSSILALTGYLLRQPQAGGLYPHLAPYQ